MDSLLLCRVVILVLAPPALFLLGRGAVRLLAPDLGPGAAALYLLVFIVLGSVVALGMYGDMDVARAPVPPLVALGDDLRDGCRSGVLPGVWLPALLGVLWGWRVAQKGRSAVAQAP